MQLVGLTIAVVTENLDIVEHCLDDLLVDALKLALDLIAIVLGILGMEVVHAFSLVLNPSFDVIQLGVGHLGLLVDLFGQLLEFLQPGDLIVDHLVTFFVDHHELIPATIQTLGVEVAVDLLARVPQLSLNVPEGMGHALLLVQPRGHILHSEPLGFLSQTFHFNQSIREISILQQINP